MIYFRIPFGTSVPVSRDYITERRRIRRRNNGFNISDADDRVVSYKKQLSAVRVQLEGSDKKRRISVGVFSISRRERIQISLWNGAAKRRRMYAGIKANYYVLNLAELRYLS